MDKVAERQKIIVKSNALIQDARHSLSLEQQRILLYMIAQIKPGQTKFEPCYLSIMDFCDICGISGKAYKHIKTEVKKLADCSFWTTEDGKDKLKRWIASDPEPEIVRGDGVICLTLSRSMQGYLLDLRERFTQYELYWVLCFRRKYTVRLYEYICSRHYEKERPYTFTVTVDELKTIMGAEAYIRFSNFSQKVLIPAVEEIDRITDKGLKYVLERRGKAVTGITFTVRTQDAVEQIRRENEIQHILGLNPDQLTLWEQMEDRGIVKKEWVQDGK